ncbi:MAG: sugar phosphate nucleotidyltransferase [Bryobacteraceae bacterium]
MQVVIPMSGAGQRFQRSGYSVPKPLIEVEGKPIIAHVLDMFPGERNVVFICNREHLEDERFRMREILQAHCPSGRIVAIEAHKLGPVHAFLQAKDVLDPDEPTVINYCDFTCYWDWRDFKKFVVETGCGGCIPSYRGFHPHMLHSTNFAYTQNTNLWATAIQEKKPYTEDPSREFASSGTYYFRTGEMAIRYSQMCVEQSLALNGEYYVSLVYRPMFEAGESVAVYELQHFMQWGTPEDLDEYLTYSRIFHALAEARPATQVPAREGALIMPMAGAGQRFSDQGYPLPKPLLPVNGYPMVARATLDLPAYQRQIFVLREDLPAIDTITAGLTASFPGGEHVMLQGLTDGQARTVMQAASRLSPDTPITIGACDNGVIYDHQKAAALLDTADVDVVVWAMRGHPGASKNPKMYGWIDAGADGWVRSVSVKSPLADPKTDPAIVGVFSFRRAGDFTRAAERMIERNARINGEFYVDTAINDALALGLRCKLFTVDHYVGWGTPADYESYRYWQSCFHKWASHPYRIDADPRIAPESAGRLDADARNWRAPRPGRKP